MLERGSWCVTGAPLPSAFLLREGEPRRRMDSQVLLHYSCALPLQTLVEPHLNFCLHLHLGRFAVFARPPAPTAE